MIFCAQELSDSHRLSVFPEERPTLFYIQSTWQPLMLEDVSQSESVSSGSAAVAISRNTHLIVLFLDNSIRGINSRAPGNHTVITEFILLGLTDDPELQPIIFNVFLMVYLVTVLGNLLIVFIVISDSHLHTPMYFFLSHLSFTDICVSTTTIPKMLMNILTENQTITFTGCLSQIFFVLVFYAFENFLLAAMAYDRYVAICSPLRYTVIMNPCFCGLLMLLSLLTSLLVALLHSLMILHLSFCTDLEIPQFFCELAQLLKIACSSTLINNILIYIVASILVGVPLSGIIFSYTQIVSSVLRIQSSSGKYKAFSTCGSHLSVVSLFYGTSVGVYVSSLFTESSRKTAVASVMYTVVPQMMNPFIYSLRNKDIKVSLRKFFVWKSSL
ncbi:olfactory receptor 7G2-like [Tenrec ecaudatus]|uniref:olfactory receptor 7G2-like n=1 Tax=Tenrec ecaudatus TaxID=94439 RepID=UPI003F5A02BD